MAIDPDRLSAPKTLNDLGAALGKSLPRSLANTKRIAAAIRAVPTRRPKPKG